MTDLLTRTRERGTSSPREPEADAPASTLSDSVAHDLGVVVAPTMGRFRPVIERGLLRAGELLGHITGGGGRADEVRVPVDGEVRDLLVRPGQLVARGEGLVWLRRMGQTAT